MALGKDFPNINFVIKQEARLRNTDLPLEIHIPTDPELEEFEKRIGDFLSSDVREMDIVIQAFIEELLELNEILS